MTQCSPRCHLYGRERHRFWKSPLAFRRGASSIRSNVENLTQEITQFAAAAGVAQLPERLGFDLPHTLSCDTEGTPDLFQRVAFPILKPETHFQHLALPFAI